MGTPRCQRVKAIARLDMNIATSDSLVLPYPTCYKNKIPEGHSLNISKPISTSSYRSKMSFGGDNPSRRRVMPIVVCKSAVPVDRGHRADETTDGAPVDVTATPTVRTLICSLFKRCLSRCKVSRLLQTQLSPLLLWQPLMRPLTTPRLPFLPRPVQSLLLVL